LKEQNIFENETIRRVHLLGRLIEVLESIIVMENVNFLDIADLNFTSKYLEVIVKVDTENIEVKALEDLRMDGVRVMVEYAPLEFYSSEDEVVLGDGFKSLYDTFKNVFLTATTKFLKQYALKTRMTNVEYFMAIINGKLIVLEGEKLKVQLPLFKTYAIAHTHPIGHCMFSHKDVETTMDLFANGGLLSSIATENCIAMLRRRGPYTIDDYEPLIDLRDYLRKKKVRMERISSIIRRAPNTLLEFYTI